MFFIYYIDIYRHMTCARLPFVLRAVLWPRKLNIIHVCSYIDMGSIGYQTIGY